VAFQDGTGLVQRSDCQLRLPWRSQLPHEHHIKLSAECIGYDPRHRHRAARHAEHQGVLSPIGGKAVGKPRGGILTILETHGDDS
jgi:hypothetical protein